MTCLGVLQYFLSYGSFAAQSLYSISPVATANLRHLPLCANYMQYVCQIGTWLRPFLCNGFEFKRTKCTQQNDLEILWHKRLDLTKQFLSNGDTIDSNDTTNFETLTMNCDKTQWKFLVFILLHSRANFCFILPWIFGIWGDT